MSYWDTSTLVKLYAKEPDSEVFERHAASAVNPLTTARIALYESRATFRRKETEGILKIGAAKVLYDKLFQDVAAGQIQLIEFSAELEREYGQVLDFCNEQNPPILIRTLDAMHLASARMAAELEVVATDKRMREAAKLLGFRFFQCDNETYPHARHAREHRNYEF